MFLENNNWLYFVINRSLNIRRRELDQIITYIMSYPGGTHLFYGINILLCIGYQYVTFD